jgi:hypothetical protein
MLSDTLKMFVTYLHFELRLLEIAQFWFLGCESDAFFTSNAFHLLKKYLTHFN